MTDLITSRKKIDEIDKQIVDLFEARMNEANEVAEYKRATGKAVFDKEREKEKLDDLEEYSHNEFNKHAVRELFSQIMSISRKYQYSVLQDNKDDFEFKQETSLTFDENTKVAFFGTEGSYSHQAMGQFFGKTVKSQSAQTFREVMQYVKDGVVDYGVVPIENSSTGGITDVYQLLVEYDNYIVGEYVLKIEHALLGLPGAELKDIKTVYSHPQGILQCGSFFEQHKNIKGIEYSSTAASAKKVLEDGDITKGAIAGLQAADCYGLQVLQESLNKEECNSTRFVILTKKKVSFQNSDKCSLCIQLPHESGSLYHILSHFIYNDLNLTKIESRPIQDKTWEYQFFIDVEGDLQEPSMQNALKGIREEAEFLKILGNYPAFHK